MQSDVDDILRQLDGVGRLLMSMDATLKEIRDILREDDGEEEEAEP